jgi:hypothetical protein
MPHDIAILIALAVTVLLLLLLRANAAMVFLSLCLGEVLVRYVAGEANDLIKAAAPHAGQVSTSTVSLFLLLTPAVVTGMVTIFSVHGRLKNIVNVLPAAAVGALVVLLGVPLLTPGLRINLESQQAWHILSNAQAFVVAAGALVSLVFLWTQRRHFKEPERRKK